MALRLRHRTVAALYDRLLAPVEEAGLAELRANLLRDARGRVVEIGAGTGRNLPHYPDDVVELVLVEPEPLMARRLSLPERPYPVRVVSAAAERLPFADATFDTAVSTLVLCSVESQGQALSELRRVLRPGGDLLFLEHVRADEPGLARWQDRLNRPWRWLAVGCNCNRRTLEAIRAAGFAPDRVEHGELPRTLPLTRPLVIGSAAAR